MEFLRAGTAPRVVGEAGSQQRRCVGRANREHPDVTVVEASTGGGRGSLIQALDFKKVSIKKAEKKVPLGAIK